MSEFKVKVAFGGSDHVIEYSFGTEAERSAFLFGMREAEGWDSYLVRFPEDKTYEKWEGADE